MRGRRQGGHASHDPRHARSSRPALALEPGVAQSEPLHGADIVQDRLLAVFVRHVAPSTVMLSSRMVRAWPPSRDCAAAPLIGHPAPAPDARRAVSRYLTSCSWHPGQPQSPEVFCEQSLHPAKMARRADWGRRRGSRRCSLGKCPPVPRQAGGPHDPGPPVPSYVQHRAHERGRVARTTAPRSPRAWPYSCSPPRPKH